MRTVKARLKTSINARDGATGISHVMVGRPYKYRGLPAVPYRQLDRLFSGTAIDFHLDLAARFRGVNPASEFVRRANTVIVELSYQITLLQARKVSRTIVDYAMNFQAPLPGSRNTAAANYISSAEKALVARL